ncbi:hypothetical protein G7046_g5274 [Stylonectria norvegica]|nr:hypothetical protein G7046_g5274 [Stylonectria norvegica]
MSSLQLLSTTLPTLPIYQSAIASIPTVMARSGTSTISDSSKQPHKLTTTVLVDIPTTTSEDHHEDNQTYPPMTTPWSTPRSCTWTFSVDNSPEPEATGAVAWLDLEPIPGASSLSCYPDGMFYDGRTGIFSPGTCPNGWTTASLLVNTNEVKEKATTTAICCSSEYTLDGNHCKRSVPTVLAVPITYDHFANTYDVLTASTTTLYSATIAVYTIRALFQEEDKASLGLKDEDDIDDENHTSPLSLGARIGIGIGVGFFLLLILGCLTFYCLRKDRARWQKRRSHEMNAVQRTRHGTSEGATRNALYLANGVQHRTGCIGQHAEPPPAYEAARDSNNVSELSFQEDESGDGPIRVEEIRALRAQKATIQRRLEELEQVESNRSQERGRDA